MVKDEKTGRIIELRCTYDPQTRGGWSSDGRKVKGTLHWVSASHAIKAEVRLYDRQFIIENPTEDKAGADFMNYLNPNSLKILTSCRVEPGLVSAKPESRYQFERLGYFCVDSVDSHEGALVFNRTATLRDSWAKIEKKERKKVTIQPQTCPPLEDSHRPVRLWRINADRFKYKEITEH